MSPEENWTQIRSILDRALALPRHDQSGYLDRACAADPGLRRQVEELVAAAEEDDRFLEPPGAELAG